MFRIEVFVDDKKLVQFLNAVTGLVVSMTPPQPVVNLVSNHKNLKAATGGSISEMVAADIKKKRLSNITVKDIRAILASLGKSTKSYGYVLDYLKRQKMVKATRERGNYRVIK
jgi:hypothetical protein